MSDQNELFGDPGGAECPDPEAVIEREHFRMREELQGLRARIDRMLNVLGNAEGCKSCKQLIYFCTTKNGKTIPYDPDGRCHFETCPNADKHRKRR